MLLKASISYTKKFFQRTLQSLRSLLPSGGYRRLAKTSTPLNPLSCPRPTTPRPTSSNYYAEFDKYLTTEFPHHWDKLPPPPPRKRSKKKMVAAAAAAAPPQKEETYTSSGRRGFVKLGSSSNMVADDMNDHDQTMIIEDDTIIKGRRRWRRSVDSVPHEGKKRKKEEEEEEEERIRNRRRSELVAEKLREMMDMGNVDHVLDIEEVLHYYSRLTCPAYLHLVDNFFTHICSEFFTPTHNFP